ncbi:leucine-rich repeat domain-containing protein, partial [Bifidobacterium thermophilum]|uniref:leucine-rich repeat domain-containing protein n=1 Tax=Bifidobacterium thermophilum TaxID=33905 RepID=UPI0030AA92B2
MPDRSTIAQCFPDQALAQGIAKKLKGDAGKTGEVLTSKDVNNTTRLFTESYLRPSSSIVSLQGLQVFTNLQWLNLDKTKVSDLSPLAKLTKLGDLWLSGTQVSDVSPLAKLANLQYLHLSGTQVSNVSPLAKLAKLDYLDLSNTQVSNVSPLAKLTNLKSLNLNGTQVSDVSSLAGLAKLGVLRLGDTKVSDVSPLAKLTNLGSLDLDKTQVSNVSSLAGLTELQHLDLSETQVSDVSPLAKLTNLGFLDLSNTRVSDVSPLAKLAKLVSLCLSGTLVSDVSPLAKLTNLESLDLYGTLVSDVSPLAGLTKLEYLDLYGTGVLDLSVLHGLSLYGGSTDTGTTSFAGVRPSAKLTVEGDGSVSMPAPRWLDGTWVAPSSTSPAGGTLDAKRGVVTWKTYDPKASYSYDFKQSFTLKADGMSVEFSGRVSGVKPVAKTFAVVFDSAGGSSVASQTVEYGARAVAPKDPVRAGYVFQGWYTAKAGGSKYDFSKPVTGGLTLYARWTPVPKTFTVSFDSA